MLIRCRWSDLGEVKSPGEYLVEEIGIVEVNQDYFNLLTRKGGNPILELIGAPGATKTKDYYWIVNVLQDDYHSGAE